MSKNFASAVPALISQRMKWLRGLSEEPLRRTSWPGNWLAALSFVIFATATIMLDQPRTSQWPVEAYNAFPSAVSFSVYGAPLGSVIDNVSNVFAETYRQGMNTTIQEAFHRTEAGQVAGGHVLQVFDPIGPGYGLFASVAMLIFGPHISAVVYAFLILFGLSSFIYALRFKDRLLLVPLQCFAFTTMLLTSMVADPNMAGQIPIGGYRSFVLAAPLPALHLYFEMNDRASGAGWYDRRVILLAAQVAILVLAIVVRPSVAYVLVPLGAGWLWRIWRERRDPRARIALFRKAALVAGVAAVAVGALALASPAYVKAGRGLGNVWHRAFISLGVHPEFPFGDTRQWIDCRPHFPQGLSRGVLDANGHCAWIAFPGNKGHSPNELTPGMFSPEYERVMRDDLFRIVFAYPRQAFELYFYYKPRMIAQNLSEALKLRVTSANSRVAWLVGLQWMVFAAFVLLSALRGGAVASGPIVGVLAIMFLLSTIPGFAAWSNAATAADTIFFMYCLIGLASAAVADFVVRLTCRITEKSRPALGSHLDRA